MAGRLIGKGSASSRTVASPSASRRTIERRVGSDKAAKTTSNRSGAVTGIGAIPLADTSQLRYLTEYLTIVKDAGRVDAAHRQMSSPVATMGSSDRQPYAHQPRG